jgi:hypothetical protein
MNDAAYEALRSAWGFPSFAREFPRHDELDRLVAAFANGDYRAVNEGAVKLVASAEDDAVKAAARTLAERTRPDPASRTLFLVTGALLALLTGWWVAHDGPPADAPPAPTSPVPTVEYVK